MGNRIEKKIRPQFFEKVLSGEKTFEFRLADFDIKKGDVLVLREWDPEQKDYTGRQIEKRVTVVIKTKGSDDWHNHTPEEIEKYGWQVIGME
ncbi:MAG: DUF3850 domain-containing protein [Patescibacteria group bacterium]|jgi:hypothetical protein